MTDQNPPPIKENWDLQATGSRECRKCGGVGHTLDCRPVHGATRRRKVCTDCEHRWTTYEIVRGEEPPSSANLRTDAADEDSQKLQEIRKILGGDAID